MSDLPLRPAALPPASPDHSTRPLAPLTSLIAMSELLEIVPFTRQHILRLERRGSPIVGFSPRKAALVLYIVTVFRGAALLLAKLGKLPTGKFCHYVKRPADFDLGILRKLVDRPVATVRVNYPD